MTNTKIRTHRTNPYLINPHHLITVYLIGCGGTVSQMLTQLARIHTALVKTGHMGLHVWAFDSKKVTEANLGRQAFYPCDLGQNKAQVLISRINRYMGLQWTACDCNYDMKDSGSANILITAVDEIDCRIMIEEKLEAAKRHQGGNDNASKPYYWLDMGNKKDYGQVVLGTMCVPAFDKDVQSVRKLLRTTEKYDYKAMTAKNNEPSCSTMEALEHQDLFTNIFMADYGAALLWRLLFHNELEYHGAFINLKNFTSVPIPV